MLINELNCMVLLKVYIVLALHIMIICVRIFVLIGKRISKINDTTIQTKSNTWGIWLYMCIITPSLPDQYKENIYCVYLLSAIKSIVQLTEKVKSN